MLFLNENKDEEIPKNTIKVPKISKKKKPPKKRAKNIVSF